MKPLWILGMWIIFFIFLLGSCLASRNEQKPRLQPELDFVDIDSYLTNERKVREQFKCLMDDNAPCDAVGRWLKSRLGRAFLGECILCTPKQMENLEKISDYMEAHYPNEFRLIISKYVQRLGIQLLPAAPAVSPQSSSNQQGVKLLRMEVK